MLGVAFTVLAITAVYAYKKVKEYKPKRVIDVGSNLNLFGYLFGG